MEVQEAFVFAVTSSDKVCPIQICTKWLAGVMFPPFLCMHHTKFDWQVLLFSKNMLPAHDGAYTWLFFRAMAQSRVHYPHDGHD